jgi:hypothetical protein
VEKAVVAALGAAKSSSSLHSKQAALAAGYADTVLQQQMEHPSLQLTHPTWRVLPA